MEIYQILRGLEEKLLDPVVRKDPAEVAALLADDFVEFGSSGRVFDKRDIVRELASEEPIWRVVMSDFAVEILSPYIALATYKTTRIDAAGGASAQAIRSSIWIDRDGRWLVRFHQGTRIP